MPILFLAAEAFLYLVVFPENKGLPDNPPKPFHSGLSSSKYVMKSMQALRVG